MIMELSRTLAGLWSEDFFLVYPTLDAGYLLISEMLTIAYRSEANEGELVCTKAWTRVEDVVDFKKQAWMSMKKKLLWIHMAEQTGWEILPHTHKSTATVVWKHLKSILAEPSKQPLAADKINTK